MNLDQLQELTDKATSGPWHKFDSYESYGENKGKWEGARIVAAALRPKEYWHDEGAVTICSTFDYEEGGVCSTEEDAKFIIAARTAMPLLIEVAKAAKEARDSGYDPDGFCDTTDRIRAMRKLWQTLADLEAADV